MKIFLSWSGERSKAVALALREWLPSVIQGLETFMSEKDIEKGEPWLERIERELGTSDIGVLCLTPENLSEPWLLFEAGFLRKAASKGRVIPYLLQFNPANVKPPLGTLQASLADETGTRDLVTTINNHGKPSLPDVVLVKQFNLYWPELRTKLEAIPAPKEKPPEREDREILEEILGLVRRTQLRRGTGKASFARPTRESVRDMIAQAEADGQSRLEILNDHGPNVTIDIDRLSYDPEGYEAELERQLDVICGPLPPGRLDMRVHYGVTREELAEKLRRAAVEGVHDVVLHAGKRSAHINLTPDGGLAPGDDWDKLWVDLGFDDPFAPFAPPT